MDIILDAVEKVYREADGPVVKGITYTFKSGSFTALMGRSGSGKSTLLNMMSGIVPPTSGSVRYDDQSIFDMPDTTRSSLRAQRTATIFQDYNLLPFLTALENIELGLRISGVQQQNIEPDEALDQVGLAGFERKYPNELSGGQCQRVAIARAICVSPEAIFADEPTGALDENNSREVVKHLQRISQEGVTVIMVTHDPFIAAAADTVLELRDGGISRELSRPSAEEILETFGGVEASAHEGVQ